MYHAVDIRMCLEDLVKVLLFPDVDIEVVRPLATDELDTIDDLFRSVIEIVHDHDLVVRFQQSKGGEGANVAASSDCQSVAWCAQQEVAPYPVMRTEPTVIFTVVSEAQSMGNLLLDSCRVVDFRWALPS